MRRSHKLDTTAGNLLLLVGLYLLLFAGGLMASEQYSVYAAQSDINMGGSPATGAMPASVPTPAQSAATMQPSAPGPSLPALPEDQRQEPRQVERVVGAAGSAGQLTSALREHVAENEPSTIRRIQIPAIKVDRKVVSMGSTVQVQDGQAVQVWDVDPYRAGHHQGTSNPGHGGNIVLSGHSGGWQYPFNDILTTFST